MGNMNLLNNLFNVDDVKIVSLNKRYLLMFVIMVIIISLMLTIKKEYYYQNSFSVIGNEMILLTEKEHINNIQGNNKIIINDVMCDYSINSIEPIDSSYFVRITVNTKLKIAKEGVYKIYFGKEKLFDYIVRIIIK